MRKILITGGCGFIGSNAVNYLYESDWAVVIVDKFTYAADAQKIKYDNIDIIPMDICDVRWAKLLRDEKPDVIINFAAETHVDNSIVSQNEFIASNYIGVQRILSGLTEYFDTVGHKVYFIQISTDEVYGDTTVDSTREFIEMDPLHPNNPYSATKAAADLLVQAYYHTYKSFDYTIIRGCNNYGPGQYLEKFLPVIITNALQGTSIPIYGTGDNMREWLYVIDFVKAIEQVMLTYFTTPELVHAHIFNVGSDFRTTNIRLVTRVLKLMNKNPEKCIEYVTDRKGHDLRYALNSNAIRQLGIIPMHTDVDLNLTKIISDVSQRYI